MSQRPPCPAARRTLRRLAAVALVVVAVTACTPGSDSDDPVVSEPSTPVGAAAASSPVAELQAGLVAVLVERTYAVAAATAAIDAAGGRLVAPGAEAALAAVDASSVGLTEVLDATYAEARAPLLEALRREDRLLTDHAVALAKPDDAAAQAVREDLQEAQRELAVVIRRVVPQLDADEVAEGLGSDVRAQLATGSYDQLRTAAQQATETARLLAAGIAADRGMGSPSTEAARTRADLTGLLVEHTCLAAALARELRAADGAADSARTALGANATALTRTLADRYPVAGQPFLRSWQGHLDRLERYAAGRAAGADATAEAVLVREYPAELGRLLAMHVEKLPARSSQTELEPAVDSLLVAVDAAATGRPSAPLALRQAVTDVLPAAAFISAAVAEDLRLR